MDAYQSLGVSLLWDGNTVGKLNDISGLKNTTAFTDITSHEDIDAFTKEIPTLITAGDITFSGFFDPADTTGQIALIADQISQAKKTVSVVFPTNTGASLAFDGYVADVEISPGGIDGTIPFVAIIKPYGSSSFTVAASTGISDMAISESAVLVPIWAIGKFSYTANVLTGVASVTFTPTFAAGVTTINGNTVLTGIASSAVALNAAGEATEVICINTETNKAPKTYTVRVVRASV